MKFKRSNMKELTCIYAPFRARLNDIFGQESFGWGFGVYLVPFRGLGSHLAPLGRGGGRMQGTLKTVINGHERTSLMLEDIKKRFPCFNASWGQGVKLKSNLKNGRNRKKSEEC
jgi:hypothetical protein